MANTINGRVGAYVNLADFTAQGAANAAAERVAYSNGRKVLSNELQGKTTDLLSPMTPFNVRQIIIASYNAQVEALDRDDGDYIRMKNAFGGNTFGLVFSALARVIRIVFRVAFIWLSQLVAAYQQCTYGKYMPNDGTRYNLMAEDLRRIGYEFEDLFWTSYAGLISIVNFFAPRAISTDGLRNHYIERIDQVRARNQIFNTARTAYNNVQAEKNRVWNQAAPA